jgi:hypothetical protein
MRGVWVLIGVLAAANVALKASGPLALGHRELPRPLMAVITLLAPAVLAGLVIYETLGARSTGISVDARIIGLGTAALAIALRTPVLAVIVLAALATALARAL